MVKPIFILLLLVSCGSAQGQVQIRVDSSRIEDPKYREYLCIRDQQKKGTISFMSQAPIFNGDLLSFVENNLVYDLSILQGRERKCFVFFEVDTVGTTFNHQILKSSGIESLDNEALRISKLIKFESPANNGREPIYVNYGISVNFKLSKEKKKHEK